MTPEAMRALADLGAWPLLIGTWSLLAIGAVRKWIVMGWIYEQLREDYRALRADWAILRDQGDRNSKALELLANERDRGAHGGH